mmetsp:Transcript_23643/g.57413  ORF Transcript_23643/g.57413 Transcript_23643/m.57413 type:complete len:458 (-) Transcript_23643:39-1412(-)
MAVGGVLLILYVPLHLGDLLLHFSERVRLLNALHFLGLHLPTIRASTLVDAVPLVLACAEDTRQQLLQGGSQSLLLGLELPDLGAILLELILQLSNVIEDDLILLLQVGHDSFGLVAELLVVFSLRFQLKALENEPRISVKRLQNLLSLKDCLLLLAARVTQVGGLQNISNQAAAPILRFDCSDECVQPHLVPRDWLVGQDILDVFLTAFGLLLLCGNGLRPVVVRVRSRCAAAGSWHRRPFSRKQKRPKLPLRLLRHHPHELHGLVTSFVQLPVTVVLPILHHILPAQFAHVRDLFLRSISLIRITFIKQVVALLQHQASLLLAISSVDCGIFNTLLQCANGSQSPPESHGRTIVALILLLRHAELFGNELHTLLAKILVVLLLVLLAGFIPLPGSLDLSIRDGLRIRRHHGGQIQIDENEIETHHEYHENNDRESWRPLPHLGQRPVKIGNHEAE